MPIFSMTQMDARISELVARLTELERECAEIVAKINALRSVQSEGTAAIKVLPSAKAGNPIDRNSTIKQKIALFRRLFRGRSDVFPIRWENRTTGRSGYALACANEWQRGICEKPKVKCSACPNQAFLAVDDVSIERHLRGIDANGAPFVMGVYPMLADNTCSFLAADFDEGEWRRDAFAFRDACERHGIPVAIERSRSGNGAHAWIFFAEPIPAALARRLGAFLITDTMECVPDIGFGSYDRFFPSQDSMPAGGFGNLIALPLQGLARSSGNSEFIDESCSLYPDQWAFLSAIAPMPRAKVEHLVEEASASGKIIGVRIPLVDEDEEPWLASPSRRQTPPAIREPLPSAITVVQADQIYIPRHALPPPLIARLIRLAAFQNPEFYTAQAMRRSTHDKPRIISCAELTSHHVALPRGCFDAVLDLLASLGITAGSFFVTRAKSNMKARRRYSRPVDRSTGLICDQTIVLTGFYTRQGFDRPLRRIKFNDHETGKSLVFLTNNFVLPALTIAKLYKYRWQVELFFKWIKQHLRIKTFFGTSENAVKAQIWSAVCVYVLVAIVKKRLGVKASLYEMLQILSLTLFEKAHILQLFSDIPAQTSLSDTDNQLNLFN